METCTQSPRIAKSNTPSELLDISNLEVEIVENNRKLSATVISCKCKNNASTLRHYICFINSIKLKVKYIRLWGCKTIHAEKYQISKHSTGIMNQENKKIVNKAEGKNDKSIIEADTILRSLSFSSLFFFFFFWWVGGVGNLPKRT